MRLNKAQRAERVQSAFELRKAGKTLRQIAEILGMSHEQARIDIQGVMTNLIEESKADAREILALELARLDDMQFGIWADARRGDKKAVDIVLRIMERRARLLGLDNNKVVNLNIGPADLEAMSDDELDDILKSFNRNFSQS